MKFSRTIKLTLTSLIIILSSFSGRPIPAKAQSDQIIFAVIGDFGLAGQPLLDVSNLIKSWSPDFIVTVGDNNYPNGGADTIDDNVGQYFHEYLIRYKGKYGEGSATRRFYPALGNHDWVSGANIYFSYFGYYNRITYYDFIQGSVHFFVLDSDRSEPDGVTYNSQQGIWLRKALAASTSPFNIVVLHHAPYSSGQHGSTEYMRWPFKEWGADAVLSGHDHIYERLLVDGIPYFVNGVGGGELYDIRDILPESQVRFNQDYGAMRVEATSNTMKFQMYTRSGMLVDEYTLGKQAPAVSSITRQNADPTNAATVNFQVTFTEAVSGVDISDFVLSGNPNGANIASVNGTGNIYTVTVNTGGDGNIRLDLIDNDSIVNSLGIPLGWEGAGNGNFSTGESYTIDKTQPSVISISTISPNPTNADSVDFAVSFSEPVSGVDISDFTLNTNTNATIINVTGTGGNYTVTAATGNGDDNLRLDFIDNNSVIDLAGNDTISNFTSGASYTIDRTPPVVTSITPSSNASGVDYIVNFSEPVTGVDGGDFLLSTINGAVITNISGAGTQYVVSILMQPGSDSVRLDMNDDDSITDLLGNPLGGTGWGNGNFIGSVYNMAMDTPIALSITRAGANPTNSANISFIVTFSESVEGVDAGDFSLTNGAIITGIENSNPFYIVNVNAGTTEGEIKLDLVDDDSIHNAQGVSLGGNGIGNANFTNGESYVIDHTPPQVTSIIRASGNPTISRTADFIVTFSEPVIGVEMSDFTVTQSNIIKSTVINLQNANPFYWVTVDTGAGSGTIRLDMFDNGNITDLAGNPIATGIFTDGESFSVAKTTVDFSAPNIYALPNDVLNNSSTLSWSSVRNAQAYEIFLAHDSGFAQLVLTQTFTDTKLITSAPLPDGTYYLRVRAYDKDLNPGKFSKTYSFIVDTTPPPPPTLVSPTNGSATPKRPWLQWSKVDGAQKYQLELDMSPDFDSPDFTAATTKNTLQTKGLLKRTYYWRVRTLDSAGNWSDWSEVSFFNVR